MSPAEGGGAFRHSDVDKPVIWKCPMCRSENAGRVEDGCPHCGAGTAAEREAAVRAREHPIGRGSLQELLILEENQAIDEIDLRVFTERARLTVARALAFYADGSVPDPTQELTKPQILAWARAIDAALAGEAPKS